MAILKKGWAKYGPFSNKCLKIVPFSNRCLKIQSIFKQILKKYPSPGRGSALGAPPEAAPGVFFQKMFENGPYFQTSVWNWTYFQTSVWKWTIFGSSYFQTRHWASFSNFHHLVGDASYHMSDEASLFSRIPEITLEVPAPAKTTAKSCTDCSRVHNHALHTSVQTVS